MAKWNRAETQVLTCSHDNTARITNIETAKVVMVVIHLETVKYACWNLDESKLLTCSNDRTAKITDIVSNTCIFSIMHDGWV